MKQTFLHVKCYLTTWTTQVGVVCVVWEWSVYLEAWSMLVVFVVSGRCYLHAGDVCIDVSEHGAVQHGQVVEVPAGVRVLLLAGVQVRAGLRRET